MSGFLAQEVEQSGKELKYDFSGVDKPKTDGGLYSLRYSEFVVPLVKSVQELNAKVQSQQAEMYQMQMKYANELEILKAELERLKGRLDK